MDWALPYFEVDILEMPEPVAFFLGHTVLVRLSLSALGYLISRLSYTLRSGIRSLGPTWLNFCEVLGKRRIVRPSRCWQSFLQWDTQCRTIRVKTLISSQSVLYKDCV
jgi:hypothetical protein